MRISKFWWTAENQSPRSCQNWQRTHFAEEQIISLLSMSDLSEFGSDSFLLTTQCLLDADTMAPEITTHSLPESDNVAQSINVIPFRAYSANQSKWLSPWLEISLTAMKVSCLKHVMMSI
jgi:hypothetical protein